MRRRHESSVPIVNGRRIRTDAEMHAFLAKQEAEEKEAAKERRYVTPRRYGGSSKETIDAMKLLSPALQADEERDHGESCECSSCETKRVLTKGPLRMVLKRLDHEPKELLLECGHKVRDHGPMRTRRCATCRNIDASQSHGHKQKQGPLRKVVGHGGSHKVTDCFYLLDCGHRTFLKETGLSLRTKCKECHHEASVKARETGELTCAEHPAPVSKHDYDDWQRAAKLSHAKGEKQRRCWGCKSWFYPWELEPGVEAKGAGTS